MSCPCCGSAESALLYRRGDRLFRTTDRIFELRECHNCRLIFLFPSPSPQELASFYPSGYWWQTASPTLRQRHWHKWLQSYRRLMMGAPVRRIKRLLGKSSGRPIRILDLGCGDGLFLAGLESLGVVRLGLDQSLEALRAVHRHGGIGVIQGSLEVLPFGKESLGMITLFHVLEHLPSPHRCLQELHRVLEPGGWLVVQVPNAASLQRRLLGGRWAGFDVPRHLANYSTRNLRGLLERNGFAVVRVSHFSLRDSPAIPVMSLFPGLYPPSRRVMGALSGGHPPLVNNLLDLAYLLLVLMTVPLAWAERLIGRGGTICVEARKA